MLTLEGETAIKGLDPGSTVTGTGRTSVGGDTSSTTNTVGKQTRDNTGYAPIVNQEQER